MINARQIRKKVSDWFLLDAVCDHLLQRLLKQIPEQKAFQNESKLIPFCNLSVSVA